MAEAYNEEVVALLQKIDNVSFKTNNNGFNFIK